jgi:hypothetical protein
MIFNEWGNQSFLSIFYVEEDGQKGLYPIFPPSKMNINYLYAMPIKAFYGGIYTNDLEYCIKYY